MNYLAHLYLSGDSEAAVLGSIMADFVKGPLVDQYPAEILAAIETHRKVDAFTDAHKIVMRSRKLFSSKRRRFAGIIIDVVYDHFLAKNWVLYSDIDLNEFIAKSYSILKRYTNLLPGDLKFAAPKMIEQDWLGSYKNLEAIGVTLNRISKRIERRFNRENGLRSSIEEVNSNYSQLEDSFKVFFPELISYVENLKKNGDTSGRHRRNFIRQFHCDQSSC